MTCAFSFPSAENIDPNFGIVLPNSNLSPACLLSAYKAGIFPWYNKHPICWHSPDPRFVLFPSQIHVSHTTKRQIRKLLQHSQVHVSLDKDFDSVIEGCSTIFRPGQDGTWITEEMKTGYIALHKLGYAHSASLFIDGKLAGGLYGVSLGSVFFGESMFSLISGASKICFLCLSDALATKGCTLIDAQVYTPYLSSFGASFISRKRYLALLKKGLRNATLKGNWSTFFAGHTWNQIPIVAYSLQ